MSAHSPSPRRGRKNNNLHPNGQALIAIRDANAVYGKHGLSPPVFVRCGVVRDATWDTMVTPAQVRSALRQVETDDIEGVWGLLHEIDTQWGAMPQGGALEGYGSD